jgi:hypothetical protein
VRVDLILTHSCGRLSGTRGKQQGGAEAARQKCQRSALTRPPQEFPPAKPQKPTFFLRDLQAMLLVCGKKNLALAYGGVNQPRRSAGHARKKPLESRTSHSVNARPRT